MPYQLPGDKVLHSYKETRPCYWEPVFHSPSKNFTGTEEEFFEADHAYFYIERDNGWRSVYFSDAMYAKLK